MKKDISKIDTNFKITTSFTEQEMVIYDIRNEPFKIYGLIDYKTESEFKRMPDKVAKTVSEGVYNLNYNTAGGRLRFRTNSRYIALIAKMPNVTVLPHMPMAGTSGFDLYIHTPEETVYYKTFMPSVDMKDGYESMIYFNDNAERDLIINFPLYSNVSDVHIGIQKEADIMPGSVYTYSKPVLYYGSSITQGGCASRPGNSYQSIISRRLDCDYINLGFSGSAKGENTIIDYMSSLDISVFVCDYDHNAPTAEHLLNTHEKIYKKFREKQPDLPIILVSRPNFDFFNSDDIQRRHIVYTTYMNAINSGDKNIYYIDGQTLFKDEGRDSCTVDGCHPNDLGFMRMSETIGYVIKKIL